MDADHHWMRRALELACKGWGQTHPNPMVGAVIVENGNAVAEGFHLRAGGPHAERLAFEALNRQPQAGATLYITLEPCSTHGRTPPCTDAILESGIRRVVIGTHDPNPAHTGRGVKMLQEEGVEVICGVREKECRDLNLIFNHWITHEQMPLVAVKLALTLDGCIASRNGDSQWITGVEAREDVARWRRYFPAIVVGANTVLQDNPSLTSRIPGEAVWCPRRFILDSGLRTPAKNPQAHLFRDAYREHTTLVAAEGCNPRLVREAEEAGLGVWILEADRNGRPRLDPFLERCRAASVCGLWVEGGADVADAFFRENRADYLFAYTAPLILGDPAARRPFQWQTADKIADGHSLVDPEFSQFGADRLVRGSLR